MGSKFIEFTIGDGGQVAVEPQGFTDGTCHDATRPFEQVLGVVTSRKIKAAACAVKTDARLKAKGA